MKGKCDWCYRERDDLKKVQVIKWRKEYPSYGIRNICKECRELLKHEIRIVRDGKIKLNGKLILAIPEGLPNRNV